MENHEQEQEVVEEVQEAKLEAVEEEKEQKDELAEYKQKLLYLAADMDNLKKRTQREKEQTIKFGQERMLKDLVDVIDNFDRTVDALKLDEDEKVKNIVFGIDMIRNQFLDTLKGHGLEIVDCSKEFDPNFHEALGAEEIEDKKENEITKTIQQGYILNGRLLRAAKVMVAK